MNPTRVSRTLQLVPFLLAASFCLAVATSSGQGEPKGWSLPLESDDIGNPAIHGSTKSTNGGSEVVTGGKDIWGTADEFRFVHQKRAGDFDVVVRVEDLTAPRFPRHLPESRR